MTDWSVYSTGSITATMDGHNAVLTGSGLSNSEIVCRHNINLASSQYQRTEIVLENAPASFGANGHNDLWLRMTNFGSWATRTGIRWRYTGAGLWSLDWFNAGTATNLATNDLFTLVNPAAVAGASLVFYAGVPPSEPRRFVGILNDKIIMDETEVGTTSSLSGLYRGFGGKAESFLGLIFQPGKIRQWTANG